MYPSQINLLFMLLIQNPDIAYWQFLPVKRIYKKYGLMIAYQVMTWEAFIMGGGGV